MTELNEAQLRAVRYGIGPRGEPGPPLLVIAGAGSGKTMTLAHRVAEIVIRGGEPGRILLLTFTRRAATEMTRRAERIMNQSASGRGSRRLVWSGTFHSVANRLLRRYSRHVGLDPSFTILDRGDAADLMNLVRGELGFASRAKRFPRKDTCLAIYSRCVNTQAPLDRVLERAFPWCREWEEDLRKLFRQFVEAKLERQVLDYDDLLLYWFHLMQEEELAREVASHFDHVLVDEYQDTNVLQSTVLHALKPDGRGVTVVGDDAQAIYSFRAATVRNILDFPGSYDPPARVVTLERNYRSTQPILEAANGVIDQAQERFTKRLFSTIESDQKPVLATVEDENAQVQYVADRILAARESGVALRRQAVLFRTSHHSDLLEVELGRRDIPFVKFGGLKFLEAAHVKDMLGILRLAENPRDGVAAFRVLQLLPGLGPATARKAYRHLADASFDLGALAAFPVPASARADWPNFVELLVRVRDAGTEWVGEIGGVRAWYEPQLERLYESAAVRMDDLEQLEVLAAQFPSRERFLTELTLDPPEATGDHAGAPHLDEDFLILSTIHSAKGQEWECVYVLNAADGCIPSDMATGSPEQIDEERRLLYVAMTRARRELHLVHPHRFFVRQQSPEGGKHIHAPITRFVPPQLRDRFERYAYSSRPAQEGRVAEGITARVDVAAKLRSMW